MISVEVGSQHHFDRDHRLVMLARALGDGQDRQVDRYRFYRHVRHPDFRLALRVGDPFPPETGEPAWEITRERDAQDTAADVIAEITERGYSLFLLRARFEQIPGE
jgi:hypothetical protein